jgi:hypothetical protein
LLTCLAQAAKEGEDRLQAARETAEHARAELAALLLRHIDMSEGYSQLTAAHGQLRAAHAELEAEAAALRAREQLLAAGQLEWERERALTASACAQLRAQLEMLEAELLSSNKSAEAEVLAAEAKASAARSKLATLRQTHDKVLESLKELTVELNETAARCAALELEASTRHRALGVLQAELKAAEEVGSAGIGLR